jgi:hypothetical protein
MMHGPTNIKFGRITVWLEAGDFPAFAKCSMATDNRSHEESAVLYFEVLMYIHLEVWKLPV